MFAVSTELDEPANWQPVRRIRGAGIWAGVPGSRGAVLVLRVSKNVHVLVNLDSVVCVLC